jgi:hypothetical protein
MVLAVNGIQQNKTKQNETQKDSLLLKGFGIKAGNESPTRQSI